jgi:hypothetical protein
MIWFVFSQKTRKKNGRESSSVVLLSGFGLLLADYFPGCLSFLIVLLILFSR